MLLTTAVEALERALALPLPGPSAHALMAPRPRRQWPEGFSPARARDAAGLLLLTAVDAHAHVILTLRAHTLDRHGGQISMPGGRVEPKETFVQAALREAQEEIGLATTSVRTLGGLTAVDIPVSGFRLHPVVGVVESLPPLTPAADEVSRVLAVPLSRLLDPEVVVWRSTDREGALFQYPAFPCDASDIWGATAMVLAEFLVLLGWPGPSKVPETGQSG